MKPKIKVLTLAVGDLARSLAFYRDGLGLPTEGSSGSSSRTARSCSSASTAA